MIDGVTPYPAYKPSGIEWLGDVPAHWEMPRLGQLGTFAKGNGGNKEDESYSGVPCIRYGDLYTTHRYFIERSRSFVSPERAPKYTPIKFGDLLFAASGETIEDIGKSAVNLIPSDACCGGDVILFRARREMNARYLGYAADCQPSATYKAAMGRGFTVIHIYPGQLKRLTLALPPLPEQAAIARFLDHMDQRITRCISAKEKQIALLEEYRQAVVSEAVTGRFDVRTGKPYPAYRPSNVEWLGEVPAHWEVRRLRNLARTCFSNVDKLSKDGEQPVRLCNYSDVYYNDCIHNDMELMVATATAEEIGRYRLHAGDVVITKDSESWYDIGVPAYVESTDHDIVCGYHLALLHPLHGCAFGKFLCRALSGQGVANQLFVKANGVTRFGLSQNAIRSVWLPTPPLPEQAAIARFLDGKIEKVREGVARAQGEIDLLREWRTRLIADVVTGKLDVRAAAAELPETAALAPADGTDAPADDALAPDSPDRAA